MKNKLLCLFIIFSGLHFESTKPAIKWVITSGCSLKVDGTTNINKFSCAIPNYSNPDTIWVNTTNGAVVQLNGNIRLPVQNFDCRNPVMTADLRKTLQSKEFPALTIRFISLSKYPDASAAQEIKGQVIIELAGVSKRFEVDYKVLSTDSSFINMVGSRKINFSDFNLTPPRKLGGMIKTNNELSVEFTVKIKVLKF